MNGGQKQHLLIKHLETQTSEFELEVTPEMAGWKYCGLKVLNLKPKEKKELFFEGSELCVLPLKARNVIVTVEGKEYTLKGRDSVFKDISDFIYIPLDTKFTLYSETGGKFAFPYTKCTKKFAVAYVPKENIITDIVGGGQASRQRVLLTTPNEFHNADKLIALEVVTPSGNWSSYPPHKHDTISEHETQNEEIYFFLLDDEEKGFSFMRTYTKDKQIDVTETVRNGDTFIVPKGYHGPLVTPPGYHIYQINVMAGPAEKRSLANCDDPDHHWVRADIDKEPCDKRLPMLK